MNIRDLTHTDVEAMWVINEEGLPGTGQVSQDELVSLLIWRLFRSAPLKMNGCLGS